MRLITLALLGLSQPAFAQQMTGTINEMPVDMAVDCANWDESSRVYAAGDNGSSMDRNGDGAAMILIFFGSGRMVFVSDMSVTLGDTRFNLAPGPAASDKSGGWEIDADTARLSGIADNDGDPVEVDLLVDCTER